MPSAKSPAHRITTYKIVQAILGILFAGYLLWRIYIVFIGKPEYGTDTWTRFIIAGVILGSVYALIAIGYTLVYGILRMINFAHGDIMMIGAFGGFFVFEALKAIPSPTLLNPKFTYSDAHPIIAVFLAFIVGASIAALSGFYLEKIAYRPLRGAPRLVPLISAIGASIFLENAGQLLFGAQRRDYANPIILTRGDGWNLPIGGSTVILPYTGVLTVVLSVLLMLGLYILVMRTRLGRSMRAVAENKPVAALMGIDVDSVISRTFIISGALAGAAGVMWGIHLGLVYYYVGFIPGIKAFTAAVLGGIGSVPGAMLGGLFLGLVESIGPAILGISFQLKDVIAFVILVLVLIFRPTGIVGEVLTEEKSVMRKQIKLAMNAGITFGIITIFIFLIGFTSTVADILADLFQNKTAAPVFGLTPQMLNMLIFLGLVGLWAGAVGSRKEKGNINDPWGKALFGALITGLVHGLLVFGLVFLVGTLNLRGVKMSMYLAELLPASVTQFLLGKTPAASGLFYIVFMLLTGFLGGLVSRGIGRGYWKSRSVSAWNKVWGNFNQLSSVKQVLGRRRTRYVVYGILLVLVFLLPLRAGPYWNYTIGTIGIYVLLGLGLNIVVGLAGLLDLGYVAFFAIGAYTMALLTAPQPHQLMWSFWIALPIGVVLAALTGLLLGTPVLRMRGDYLAIVTLGFGEIIRILSKSDDLSAFTGGPKGVTAVGGPTLFGKPFTSGSDYVYLIFLAALLVIFVTNRLQHSRVGRAWEAMREDETVSRAMGINTLTQKLLAFAIGAAFAGLAGALFASRNQFTGPEDFNLMVSINVVAVVIVGGMGNIPGVIAGALVLKGLPEVLRQLQDYRVMVFGALLVVMMLWRPAGIIPSSRRKLEIEKGAGNIDVPEEGQEK